MKRRMRKTAGWLAPITVILGLLCSLAQGDTERSVVIDLEGTQRGGGIAGTGMSPIIDPLLGSVRAGFEGGGSVSSFGVAGQFGQVYPGIDLTCYRDEHHLEYAFVLGAGADPALIRFRFSGMAFETITPAGNVVYRGDGFEVYQRAPVAYRVEDDNRMTVPAHSLVGGDDAMSLGVRDADARQRERLNGSFFNIVPAESGVDGPDYSFYMTRYEITTAQWIRFLNDIQLNARNPRGENVTFDERGNAWINLAMKVGRDELYAIQPSQIRYNPDRAAGDRYSLFIDDAGRQPFADHPALGISWYGAVKYCNWLTLEAGRGVDQRCYREGTNTWDWAPVTATNWQNGFFTAQEREAWLAFKGFRMPMSQLFEQDGNARTNAFNEWLKAGQWNGQTNVVFGYGSSSNGMFFANTIDHAIAGEPQTLPVGFFNGRNRIGSNRTQPNHNGYGLYDMTGNAAEWLNDPPKGGIADARQLAGGAFRDRIRPVGDAVIVPPNITDQSSGIRPVTTFMPESWMQVNVLFCFHTTNALSEAWRDRFGLQPTGGSGVPAEPPLPDALGDGGAGPSTPRERDDDNELIPGVSPPDRVAEPQDPGIVYRDPLSDPEPDEDLPPGGGDGDSGGGVGGYIPFPPLPPEPPEPPTLYLLDVYSQNPDGGVVIPVSNPDFYGRANGETAFVREYEFGSTVTLTAPASVGDTVFQYWLRNGQPFTTSREITVQMISDLQLTAVYVTPVPPPQRTLIVDSTPGRNVPVIVSEVDNDGFQNGNTYMTRTYDNGTQVSVSAPETFEDEVFQGWLRNGELYSLSPTVNVTLFSDTRLTALYGPPTQPEQRRLLVQSENPDEGVGIAVDIVDLNGLQNGDTSFVRNFELGKTVTLTAPATAPNGNTFVHWLRNGEIVSLSEIVTVKMLSDYTYTAVYESPPEDVVLTVGSTNPDSGVTIGIGTADNDGNSDGDTSFTRRYDQGESTTVTAPAVAPNGNVFSRWVLNGSPLSTNPTVSLTLLENAELIAVYQRPPPPIEIWSLQVQTENPGSGVGIYVSAADTNGNSSGTSAFTRYYEDETPVSLTAPTNAPNGNIFSHWMVDGVRYSDQETISLVMTGNRSVTAVYIEPVPPVRYVLTVESRNPNSAILVTVEPGDVNGQQNGSTTFTRLYDAGQVVTLTARNPAFPGSSNVLRQWLIDGVPYSTNDTITVNMLRDTTVTAVYGPELIQQDRTLTVLSQDPDSGVPITIDVPDLNGNASDITGFDRIYSYGTNVTVTAPAVAPNGNRFEGWLLGGFLLSTNTTVTVAMLDDVTLTAVYTPPPVPRTLTVSSQNPASGIDVSVSDMDNNGNQDGSTTFQRIYDDGTTVTLVAPPLAPNGRDIFQHWLRDGVAVSTNATVDVALYTDIEMTAVYTQPPTFDLTVRSENPDRNVPVDIGTADVLGRTDGDTLFVRTYDPGQTTTVTAPQVLSDGTEFQYWLRNGVQFSTNTAISVTMLSDLELTAVYGAPAPLNRSLTVRSVNPDGGVPIEITPGDIRGQGDGDTGLLRIYPDGEVVTVTAPATAGTNSFRQWILNGVPLSSNLTETVTMFQDQELIAVYESPIQPIERVLTVDSRNPNSGVPISVSTPDISGNTDGDTVFVRIYNFGETTTLVAPESGGTNNTTFLRWERNGEPYSEDRTITVEMLSDMHLTAVYGEVIPDVTLTVESQNPDSGVVISVAPADLNSETTGTTTFQRIYELGQTVTLSAPTTAEDRPFLYWLFDGTPLSTNPVVNVTLLSDRTMTAVYGDPVVDEEVTLTVRAEGPDGDITTLISATPDNNSNASGSTTFTRIYDNGQLVTLNAPEESNGLNFDHWEINGVIYSNNTLVSLTLLADTTITAVYVEPAPSVSGL